jgi:hypothetical protein
VEVAYAQIDNDFHDVLQVGDALLSSPIAECLPYHGRFPMWAMARAGVHDAVIGYRRFHTKQAFDAHERQPGLVGMRERRERLPYQMLRCG